MKSYLSLLTSCILFLTLVFSCSTDYEESVAPVVQTPQPEPEATQYTLTVTAGEGGTVSTEGGSYDEGTTIAVTAIPDDGYEFVRWEGSDETEIELVISINSNITLNAIYRELVSQFDSSIKYKVYVASDVSQDEKQGVERALEIASNEWDIDILVEYWVVGRGIQEANDLANVFCERRQELGQLEFTHYNEDINQDIFSQCLEGMMFPNQSAESILGTIQNWSDENWVGDFERFRDKGGAGAGIREDWGGIGFVTSSQSMVQDFTIDELAEFSYIVVFHEYFHIVQNFYGLQDNSEEIENHFLGDWFYEGGADFMAHKLVYQEGLTESYAPSFQSKYRDLMSDIQSEIESGNNLSQQSLDDFSYYTSPWNPSVYSFGAWAIAYLNFKADNNNSLNEYFSKVPLVGWEQSFQETYSITLEEFYVEFNEFLKKPIDEQLEIIPDF
ncbi:hypothetical protein N9D15_02345 [Flavobacteriaceae bacterium]|nr:hypothetical protein [Flavobacteriaceae bacterium]